MSQACDLQKQDLEDSESRIKDLQEQMYREKVESNQKLLDTTRELEGKNSELESKYTTQLQEQEEVFNEERTKIREQLHEVTANEASLLNRIKCLEAEEGSVKGILSNIFNYSKSDQQ